MRSFDIAMATNINLIGIWICDSVNDLYFTGFEIKVEYFNKGIWIKKSAQLSGLH